jgi:hypothetical protein
MAEPQEGHSLWATMHALHIYHIKMKETQRKMILPAKIM